MVSIKTIECEGLYSYKKKFSVSFDTHTIIVGPNNSGKTNLFRIIKLFTETIMDKRQLFNNEIAHSSSTAYVKLELELTTQETQHLVDFLDFYTTEKSHSETVYYGFKNPEKLSKLLQNITVKFSWKRSIEHYGSTPVIEIYIKKLGLYLFNYMWSSTLVVSTSSYDSKNNHPSKKDLHLSEFLDKISVLKDPKQGVKKLFKKEKDTYLHTSALKLSNNAKHSDYSLQTLSKLFSFCEIPQSREQEISFQRVLGQIFLNSVNYSNNASFDLTLFDTIKKLELPTSVGVFPNTENSPGYIFNETLKSQANKKSLEFTDILNDDGSNLPQFLFSLRNSQISDKRKKFEKIKEAFDDLFKSDNLSLDVILDYHREVSGYGGDEPKQLPTTPKIIIIDKNLDIQYSIQQVGSGLKEIIYLLTVSLGQTDSILLLDEPAINLHPPIIQKLLQTISKKEYNNQIIIISHLPELVEFELFDSNATLLYISKKNNSTRVHSLNSKEKIIFSENRSKLKHIINTRIFFGKCIILVEGQTEKNLFVIMGFLENKFSKFSTRDILVINIGSMCNFKKYQKYLKAFNIPYMILADLNAASLFKHQSVGKIHSDRIEGKGKIFLVADGNIEDLMKKLDKKLYESIEKKIGKSKPAIAFEFAQKLYEKNSDKLLVFQKFFELAMKKIS